MSQPQAQRTPYSGLQRKLIIAFDVGTTFSGVSYALLIPREPPVIQGVTQFPGQQKVGGDSKIPSIICYDEHGNVVAVGSEADIDTNPELLEVEGLVRAEWFKLHLRPPHLVAEQNFNVKDIPPLPRNKTVIDIFSDLLGYLYKATTQYIRERQGDDVWESIGTNVEFILSHPNGWEGKQQSEMRRAAINAGLVATVSEASERISFVTEGEASLHFCLNKIPTASQKYAHDGILIADCGGGTVDISTYARFSGKFKEIAPAECLLQGSFFVSRRAQRFLTVKLRGSRFGTLEDIEVMTRYFDKTTKPSFKGSSKPYFVRFGRSENDEKYDIRSGSVKLNSAEIANFFKPAIQNIITVIEEQATKSSKGIKAIFMVGGFATSDYLFSKLEDHFKMKNIDILRPDTFLNKAVAEGAILFALDHFVSSRVAKYAYGTEVCNVFDPSLADHLARQDTSYEVSSGEIWVPHRFSSILQKDTEVSEETEFRASYRRVYSPSQFRVLEMMSAEIKCYRNRAMQSTPAWIDLDPLHFADLCNITADMTSLKSSIRPRTNHRGAKYYTVSYDIVLLFGLTELKAQIAWTHNGVEKRGPASIVYDTALPN